MVVNLDPAAEEVGYECVADVRTLISVEDAAEELRLGPNGSLVYCMEYLCDNVREWFADTSACLADEDYVLFDCPGQAELYEHLTCMRDVVRFLQSEEDFRLCCVYVLDSGLVDNVPRLIGGVFSALSAMAMFELPHVSVLSKVDLMSEAERRRLESDFLEPEARSLLSQMSGSRGKLDECVAQLIDDFSQVSFVTCNITSDDSIDDVLALIDSAIQVGEDAEVIDRLQDEMDDDDNDASQAFL